MARDMTCPSAATRAGRAGVSLPRQAGIGLRAPHLQQVRQETPAAAWFEVHSENYFAAGGPALAALEAVRQHYPLSLHGVGMSLGSADALDRSHLRRLRALAERIGAWTKTLSDRGILLVPLTTAMLKSKSS